MSRVQLALNVTDLEASIDFYRALFGCEPHKRREGYANFAIENPPLKLVLIEVPADERGAGTTGALNHLGIEVFTSDEVIAATQRLTDEGLATFTEDDTTCCYALQDKVWVHDPAGAPWEVYVVKDDNPESSDRPGMSLEILGGAGSEAACCTTADPRVAQSSC